MQYAIAIDIGGTKIAAAVIRSDGEIMSLSRAPAPQTLDSEAVFSSVLSCTDRAICQSGVDTVRIMGVGCGCGGPMRWPEGAVSPINIPAWRDFQLRERLMERFPDSVVRVHNDAVALSVGEHWLGKAAGGRDLLAITVSTGVGGGLILDGKLFHGKSGNAGHVGHVIIEPDGPPCACGARGCLEAIASGPSSVKWAREHGWQPCADAVPDGAALAESAEAGDSIAGQALARAGDAIGQAAASQANMLDLDIVVIAGGFAKSGTHFWDALHAAFAGHATMEFARRTRVEMSGSINETGLLGAAGFVLCPERYGWTI